MRKILFAGCAVCLCFFMVACGSGGNKNATTTTAETVEQVELSKEELIELFDSYSLDSGTKEADEIMEAFAADFPLFLETLSEYESSEQILMLVGMKVKAANENGNAEYQNAINSVDAAELTEAQKSTLDQIKANVEN